MIPALVAAAYAGEISGEVRERGTGDPLKATISASGQQTTTDSARMPMPPWGLRCVSCAGIVARRHRRSLNLDLVRCKHCGPNHGLLNWVRLE